MKIYDYPMEQASENGKRQLREFGIEELLFRKPVELDNVLVTSFYSDKVVLITGWWRFDWKRVMPSDRRYAA